MARALIVDDDADIRELLRAILSRAGHEVVTAVDGADAVQHLATEHFDVVVLDVEMPEMSGLDVLQASGGLDRPRPPVVMLSGLTRARDATRGLQAGAGVYLTKPFRREELMAAVNALLDRSTV